MKLILKTDFVNGSSLNLLDSVDYTCGISGWFNESIGSYTCTRNCTPPKNYSSVMTNNWDRVQTNITYGTTFR